MPPQPASSQFVVNSASVLILNVFSEFVCISLRCICPIGAEWLCHQQCIVSDASKVIRFYSTPTSGAVLFRHIWFCHFLLWSCLFVVCVCVWCTHVWSPEVNLGWDSSGAAHPFFFFYKRFCHWYLGCHWLAGLAGQWTSWILLFLLLRLQTHATMPFSVSSDDQTQVLMFIQQSLYWVSIPSTTLLFMYCKYFLHSEFPFLFFPFLLKRILCFNINFHICNCRFG